MKFKGTMQISPQGHLTIGGCDVTGLAREFGTPLYIMDEAEIRKNCRAYVESFAASYPKTEIIYASKVFANMAMLAIVEEENMGLDVVSGGELYTALKVDFPVQRIYFHGNNKLPEELEMALDARVGRIIVDNISELELLNELARQKKMKAPILLRIAPGIDAHTHHYIKTGTEDSKFGLGLANGQAGMGIEKALGMKNVELKGIHCHIGSQIFDLEAYAEAAQTMMCFVKDIAEKTGYVCEDVNLGGGLGIHYTEEDTPQPIATYAKVVSNALKASAAELNLPLPKLILEPGRSLVGEAGSTLYTVGTIKEIPGIRKYVAVDGGMTDNIRPALYQAKYEAALANKMDQSAEEVVSIAGKCCESGDMLIWDIELPRAERGDLLLVASTGAYNYSMASNYNRNTRPAVVMVKDGAADLIVQRESYEDLVKNDVLPERMRKKEVQLA